MRRKLLKTVLSVIVLPLFLAVPRLSAQDDIFVTPIPNSPFSGLINVERSIVRQDGTVVNLKTVRAIHRDSRGRIYNEYRTLLPASSSETPQCFLLNTPTAQLQPGARPRQRHPYSRPTDRRTPLRVRKTSACKRCRGWGCTDFAILRRFRQVPAVQTEILW